ncbi:pentapeptide repeat-containing protein [Robertmurraya massiliosenegalensis]|uniref:pentapeptide repeat-containing protein n=1 Tax=Robertmurraya TaxID=2837507 RepID=UPI0039A75C00
MNLALTSDCHQCFGLCCVALPYANSADFPINKDGGVPCRHLSTDHRCNIHNKLKNKGFNGCVAYECFGAGQYVSQKMYDRQDWRNNPELSNEMFAVFPLIQQLHEMLWYLDRALCLKEVESLYSELQNMYDETVELTRKSPEEIFQLDMQLHRSKVNQLLVEVSEIYRKQGRKKEKKSLDYIGANLSGRDFKGSSFRGTLMIAANLSHADLRKADFIGTDLRDADLSHANLAGALFLTQSQINSAKGNVHTKIPEFLEWPKHWL